ncbi:MAG: hypothetical protein ACR2RE_07835 [Geminicoccaceae bacterium]
MTDKPEHTAEPVTFDGTKDFLVRGTDLTKVTDGYVGTISIRLPRKD